MQHFWRPSFIGISAVFGNFRYSGLREVGINAMGDIIVDEQME